MIFQKWQKNNIFTNYVQTVNKPIQISGSLIDPVYIKKPILKEFYINITSENICLSDNNAVRIINY